MTEKGEGFVVLDCGLLLEIMVWVHSQSTSSLSFTSLFPWWGFSGDSEGIYRSTTRFGTRLELFLRHESGHVGRVKLIVLPVAKIEYCLLLLVVNPNDRGWVISFLWTCDLGHHKPLKRLSRATGKLRDSSPRKYYRQ